MRYWLLKTEPEVYSWDDFVRANYAVWDGVRNFQARNYMKEMSEGDEVLFYHSGKMRLIMGVGRVIKAHYQDPTSEDLRWVAVDLCPVKPFKEPVSLKKIKADESLQDLLLVRQQRLSVMPVSTQEFNLLCLMSEK